MKKSLGDKHMTAFEDDHMIPNEVIQNWVTALRKGETFEGRLITTDQRLVYYRKGRLSQKLEAWSINKISSVEMKTAILSTGIKIFTSGDKIELDIWGDKHAAKEYINELQHAINSDFESPINKNVENNSQDDPIEKITELGKLRDAGIVTEEEFQSKKKELLARI